MVEEVFSIATVDQPNGGRLGVCQMPGLDDDLEGDLLVIQQWSPAMVLTMTEQHELDEIGVADLGARVRSMGCEWEHLPIVDFGGPGKSSASRWPGLSVRLHDILSNGGGVLLHCRGGRGRSGMIAMRLMVEAGETPDDALQRLRAVRRGAVETEEQRVWAAIDHVD